MGLIYSLWVKKIAYKRFQNCVKQHFGKSSLERFNLGKDIDQPRLRICPHTFPPY